MTDYTAVLNANYIGDEWSIVNNDYDTLEWYSTSAKPTQAELDAQWPAVDYQNQYDAVSNTRHKEYIKTSDPIFFEWQRGANTKEAWEAAVQTIKDANPYPPAPSQKN